MEKPNYNEMNMVLFGVSGLCRCRFVHWMPTLSWLNGGRLKTTFNANSRLYHVC